MTILIDTSFLLALSDYRDPHHRVATDAIRIIRAPRVIPVPVLPEAFYMISIRVNYAAAIRFLEYIQRGGFDLESLSFADTARTTTIMRKYADSKFDFVDCCIMALAERLNVTRILTFDRRDFPVFRPAHCDYLELLP